MAVRSYAAEADLRTDLLLSCLVLTTELSRTSTDVTSFPNLRYIKLVGLPIKVEFFIDISSEYSAQRQVLHCKRRNMGCSCAEGRSFTANSGTKIAVLLGIE